jgi:putative transposase
MAGADRTTIEEVVKRVLVDEQRDLVRAALEPVCRELMEGGVSELVGAALGERRPDDRLTHRNGYRRASGRPGQARSGRRVRALPREGAYPSVFVDWFGRTGRRHGA